MSNRELATELLPIITAFVEGKTIQFSSSGLGDDWRDRSHMPDGSLPAKHYRIKPEPRVFYGITGSLPTPSLYRTERERDEVFNTYKKRYPSWKKITVIEQL